jgi:hypothetical protein
VGPWATGMIGIAGSVAAGAAAQGPPPSAQPVPRAAFLATMDAEFRKLDSDRNGIATRAEIEQSLRGAAALAAQQRKAALFRQLDSDKNGQLSPGEFAGLNLGTPAADAAPVMAQADLNKDQQVTLVEYRTAKLANFDRIDADKDGIVSAAEMKAAGLIK